VAGWSAPTPQWLQKWLKRQRGFTQPPEVLNAKQPWEDRALPALAMCPTLICRVSGGRVR
jgi:hypothetical protein